MRTHSEQLPLPLEPPPPPKMALPELWTPDDIYEAASPPVIGLFKEDNRVERKSARAESKDVAAYLSVFANSQPHGGVIFVGVENDGSLSGCKRISHEQLQKLQKMGEYCSDARYDTKLVEVTNSDGQPDIVLAIRVFYRHDKLVEMNDGEAYVRFGDSKRRLTEQEKREIRISKGEIDYEKEDVNLRFPNDFEMILIREFCINYITKRGLTGEHSQEDILVLNHLGRFERQHFKPNLACTLLFAKDPRAAIPGAIIRFMRYEGSEERSGQKFNAVKDDMIEGPLPRQIQLADRLIQSQMRDFTRLGRDGRFYTSPEYPRDAWLEAIVNACVHRSYNLKNMVIFVKMFQDRFVVESPGGFPPPVNPSNIYDSHNPRNPHLMYALFYLDYVKCAHEGTRRMRDVMSEANLPTPEFAQKEVTTHQVHVTLKNDYEARKTFIDAEAVRLLGADAFHKLESREKVVINYVAERGEISVSDVNRVLKCDWRTARNILDRLCAKTPLTRVSSGKRRDPGTRYVLMVKRDDDTQET